MAKRHPLLKLARLLCDLDPILYLLEDNEPTTIPYVDKQFEVVDACIKKSEPSLKEYELYEPVVSAFSAARAFAKERRVNDAQMALLSVTRALLEISGQNDIWRKAYGFGHSSPTTH